MSARAPRAGTILLISCILAVSLTACGIRKAAERGAERGARQEVARHLDQAPGR